MITVGVSSHRRESENGHAEYYSRLIMYYISKYFGDTFEYDPFVNVVFDLPGQISSSGFDGFMVGHYSKKERGVLVAIAVPETVASSSDPEDDLINLMRKALQIGAEFLHSKGHPYDLKKADLAVRDIGKKLKVDSSPEGFISHI